MVTNIWVEAGEAGGIGKQGECGVSSSMGRGKESFRRRSWSRGCMPGDAAARGHTCMYQFSPASRLGASTLAALKEDSQEKLMSWGRRMRKGKQERKYWSFSGYL